MMNSYKAHYCVSKTKSSQNSIFLLMDLHGILNPHRALLRNLDARHVSGSNYSIYISYCDAFRDHTPKENLQKKCKSNNLPLDIWLIGPTIQTNFIPICAKLFDLLNLFQTAFRWSSQHWGSSSTTPPPTFSNLRLLNTLKTDSHSVNFMLC